MHERDVGLQEAIDILTEMLNQRVNDYIKLKSQLPSFGADVDAELQRYLHALENFVQGTVLWYYLSPSKCNTSLLDSKLDIISCTGYFRGVDVTNRENLVVPLFEKGVF
jgi:hypothetical protein